MTLVDQPERTRIRQDLDTTFVVEAAAGTGKTTELIGRILSVLRSGHGELARMVAVTFTEKAAGELKLRLRAELDRARAEPERPDEERERINTALEQLEVARIGTIHSFCSDILRERPLEARVDPAFVVATEEDSAALLERAFGAWFERVLEDPPEGVRRYLRRRPWSSGESPKERLVKACSELVEHRDHDTTWRRDAFDRAAAIDAFMDAATALGAMSARARDTKSYLTKSLAALHAFAQMVGSREAAGERDYDWLEAEILALERGINWKRKGSGKYFAEGVLRADVVAQRDELHARLERFRRDADADLAACLFGELQPVVRAYEQLKAAGGALDFLDLLLRARDLVRERADVRRELQERFSHIYVDEFQDTDPLQAELMLLLAADDPAESVATACRPVPGKLFVVGDPKQSIYRFRRADVAIYSRIKAQLVAMGAQVLYLRTSFRGVPAIQSAVNASFEQVMRGADDGSQAEYVALEAHRADNADQPSVIALPVPEPFGWNGRVTKKAVAESTPDAVAAFVDWLIGASGWTVEDAATGDRVPVSSGHVCLLFKQFMGWGKDLTRPYVRALEARRVPHVLIGGRSFHHREEIMALRAAINAIEWPDDELHVYATLRGPFVALSDAQLLAFREGAGRFHPLRPLDDSVAAQHPEVVECLQLLRTLHLSRNRRPIADTIRAFLDATRAHAGVAIWPTGEQALANVLRTLEEARRFEARGTTSFRSFVDWFEDRADRGQGAQAPVVEEGSEGVRMMTVHKAKGLEFPIVILCDPGCNRTRTRPSRYIDTDKKLWVFALAGCIPSELHEHEADVLRADNAEDVRVGYVASTRARDLLVVPACGEQAVAGWVDLLHPSIYPPDERKRAPTTAPGCPPFGDDSIAVRSLDAPPTPEGAVAPGFHAMGQGHVVWWDPNVLDLERPAIGGVRQQELLVANEGGEGDASGLAAYEAWKQARAEATAAGAVETLRVRPTTQLAETGETVGDDVDVVEVGADEQRPGGRRFGTLVHAVLADVPLQAGADEIRRLVELNARILGATSTEADAAIEAVRAALSHPLMIRAATAEAAGLCYRELPLHLVVEDGTIADGIADLVFREVIDGTDTWLVVDYKTDAKPGVNDTYKAQVALYQRAVAAATGQVTRGVLFGV